MPHTQNAPIAGVTLAAKHTTTGAGNADELRETERHGRSVAK